MQLFGILSLRKDEEEETPLAKYEKETSNVKTTKLIVEGKVQQTTGLLHVAKNLILGGEGDTTLVRPLDGLQFENIKT